MSIPYRPLSVAKVPECRKNKIPRRFLITHYVPLICVCRSTYFVEHKEGLECGCGYLFTHKTLNQITDGRYNKER